MGYGTAPNKIVPRVPLRHGEGKKDHLTSFGGLAALSLDALSSVAYGPEAIVLVLAAAGTSALRLTLPITVAITVLLAVLVISYCQVIAVHPDGGGAYAVGKKDLGATVSLLAAASLVVDYVLTVAVSLAAGAASLASVFPSPAHHILGLTLLGLVLIATVNLWGVAESARAFMVPMLLFLVAIFAIIGVGLTRSHPAAVVGTAAPVHAVEAVSLLLILKAFAAGCSALTGIEAIANGVSTFREPRAKRAQRTELMLGALLGSFRPCPAGVIEGGQGDGRDRDPRHSPRRRSRSSSEGRTAHFQSRGRPLMTESPDPLPITTRSKCFISPSSVLRARGQPTDLAGRRSV